MKVLDAPAPQRPPQSPPPLDHEWDEDGAIDVFGGVLFFWRYRYLIVAATLVAAAAGWIVAAARPTEYTALSTVFVNIPRTQNPLAPDALSVEALDRLANSELVSSQVVAELSKKNLLVDGHAIVDLRTVLYKSSEPQKPYLPLVGLSVVATSPELARDGANAWASVLMSETRKLTEATRASAVDFIVTEYPKAAERLTDQERNLDLVKRDQGSALQTVRMAAATSLKEEQLWSRERLVVELEAQRTRLAVELAEAEATVLALDQELKQTPQLIVVSKAISDEALWTSTVAGGGKVPDPAPDARLRSQEINPVHVDLARRLAEARVRRTELTARRPALDAQIERTRKDAASIRASLGAGELSIENLERQHLTEVAAREREIEGTRATFKKLEERIGDAQIVKADRESTLALGSVAESPAGPSGPRAGRMVGLAGLAGFALAVFAAWITDRSKRRQATA